MKVIGSMLELDDDYEIPADQGDWIWGGGLPDRSGPATEVLAFLLEHTPVRAINGQLVWMLTSVRSGHLGAALKTSTTARVVERRGWTVEKRRVGSDSRARNWLVRGCQG